MSAVDFVTFPSRVDEGDICVDLTKVSSMREFIPPLYKKSRTELYMDNTDVVDLYGYTLKEVWNEIL